MRNIYHKETPVIYRMPKHSKNPGKRARQVTASRHGDDYHYCVDKYWLVDEVCSDGTIRIRTRRGKPGCWTPMTEIFVLRPGGKECFLPAVFQKKLIPELLKVRGKLQWIFLAKEFT